MLGTISAFAYRHRETKTICPDVCAYAWNYTESLVSQHQLWTRLRALQKRRNFCVKKLCNCESEVLMRINHWQLFKKFSHTREKRLLTLSYPSVCPHYQFGLHLTDFNDFHIGRLSLKSVYKFQIWVKIWRNIGRFTWRPKWILSCLRNKMVKNELSSSEMVSSF